MNDRPRTATATAAADSVALACVPRRAVREILTRPRDDGAGRAARWDAYASYEEGLLQRLADDVAAAKTRPEYPTAEWKSSSLRKRSSTPPRRGRGGAATRRLHGISTSWPRRRRDPPPRNASTETTLQVRGDPGTAPRVRFAHPARADEPHARRGRPRLLAEAVRHGLAARGERRFGRQAVPRPSGNLARRSRLCRSLREAAAAPTEYPRGNPRRRRDPPPRNIRAATRGAAATRLYGAWPAVRRRKNQPSSRRARAGAGTSSRPRDTSTAS